MQNNDAAKTRILSIAGNDSSGLAGVSADQRAIHALGAHAFSAITANTAQTSEEFYAINPVNSNALASQINASLIQEPHAIKIGLLASIDQLHTVSELLRFDQNSHNQAFKFSIKGAESGRAIVYDPVLSSTNGFSFCNEEFVHALRKYILPICTLVTPNISEAEKLSGKKIDSKEDVETVAKSIMESGCQAVLIKGGHLRSENAQDFFCSREKSFWLTSPRAQTQNMRGTGCSLSSAIATALGLGYSLYDACVIGKMALNQGLRNSYEVADSAGPLRITHFPNQQQDLPVLSTSFQIESNIPSFQTCNEPLLDLYPVVDSSKWLTRLLPYGVTTMQLRIKDLNGDELEKEIKAAIRLASKFNCRLFINDYWQLAIKYGAYGVHLGQEDLDSADIGAIRSAGLRLGISTHCHYEVARAHGYRPSYIAIGPVFPTKTKDMPWIPQGVAGFSYWRKTLSYPLVAIGGISDERIVPLLKAGADSIAMITAITRSASPESTMIGFKNIIDSFRASSSG